MNSTITKKKDFVEIKYTGYANSEIFDSNIEEDLKKLNKNAKPQKTIVAIGEGMVVSGLDKALEGKEVGKEYEVSLSKHDAFGERKRDLIKTIPLKAFKEQNFDPRPGMVLTLDNSMAKIIAVSGARVITDFNNPLAGKEIHYKFKITHLVTDEKEKTEALLQSFFNFIPEFEIKDKIIIKGAKQLEVFVKIFNEKFKSILGKNLEFEELKQESVSPSK